MKDLEKKHTELQVFDLTTSQVPDLREAKVIEVDLTSEYWTPVTPGDYKLCFFQEIKNSTYTDDKTGEIIELPCVVLIEQTPDKQLVTIRNGSKRLVATLEDALNQNTITKGSPLKIEYLGKQKNSTNSFQSDRWSVKPLIIG